MERLYYFSSWLYSYKVPVLPRAIMNFIHVIYSCSIPYKASIGSGLRLGHGGLGVVINQDVVIGRNCKIGTCVTIGGTNKNLIVPRIGNNVVISTGAKLLGPITIGDNVVIGANAVVVNDVKSNCVVAGIPAKIIKENININDYI